MEEYNMRVHEFKNGGELMLSTMNKPFVVKRKVIDLTNDALYELVDENDASLIVTGMHRCKKN